MRQRVINQIKHIQNHWRHSMKKAIFTGKHLRWRLKHRYFPVNISKIFKNTYLEKHLGKAASVTEEPQNARAEYYQLLLLSLSLLSLSLLLLLNVSRGMNQVSVECFILDTTIKVQ